LAKFLREGFPEAMLLDKHSASPVKVLLDEFYGEIKDILVFCSERSFVDLQYKDLPRIISLLECTEDNVRILIAFHKRFLEYNSRNIEKFLKRIMLVYGQRVRLIKVNNPLTAWAFDTSYALKDKVILVNKVDTACLSDGAVNRFLNNLNVYKAGFFNEDGFRFVTSRDLMIEPYPALPQPADLIIAGKYIFVGPAAILKYILHNKYCLPESAEDFDAIDRFEESGEVAKTKRCLRPLDGGVFSAVKTNGRPEP